LTGWPNARALSLVYVCVVAQLGVENPGLGSMKPVRSIPHDASPTSCRPSNVPVAAQAWL
jgi:hypothetical protein